jgi:hypothetical protein
LRVAAAVTLMMAAAAVLVDLGLALLSLLVLRLQ